MNNKRIIREVTKKKMLTERLEQVEWSTVKKWCAHTVTNLLTNVITNNKYEETEWLSNLDEI